MPPAFRRGLARLLTRRRAATAREFRRTRHGADIAGTPLAAGECLMSIPPGPSKAVPVLISDLARTIAWDGGRAPDADALVAREWLVTNGLGGYASGTVAGVLTRRYHGFLIAALPGPHGRTVMLSGLVERLRRPDGTIVVLSGEERAAGGLHLPGAAFLREFRLEAGLPVWKYEIDDIVLEKRVLMPHHQNTVHIGYRLLKGNGPLRLVLRPLVNVRAHHLPVSEPLGGSYTFTAIDDRYELGTGPALSPLRLLLRGTPGAFTVDARTIHGVRYRLEAQRGYDSIGDLYSPGYFRADLDAPGACTLVASTESLDVMRALAPEEALAAERERRRRLLLAASPAARHGMAAELVLAADQFIISPVGRVQDAARSQAVGEEARTIIAGYHWFTDWGRDTMISLDGLTLVTGRHAEAAAILRTFAYHVRDGLIPNMFPEGDQTGLYHTADATLWFFHAVHRYLETTGDRDTLRSLLPQLADIVEQHLKGTHFGIGVDPQDGLLRQGSAGYQLTWMDAKVDDWVVTPRRGKAVEINALWYNALRLLEDWLREESDEPSARLIAEHAERARASFNTRFWFAGGGYLYDVVDGEHGDDCAFRPNQLFAISLTHPVLEAARWPVVLETIRTRLLTPVGLRTLAPDHPDYKASYDGDLRARDAAYHQGTVWPWLFGPFVDVWLRVTGDRAGARALLEELASHLGDAGVGSIGEIFDAREPFTPRGCVAQAWSVAEILRCLVKTAE
jgi:predicted glycogen debranching enzyme